MHNIYDCVDSFVSLLSRDRGKIFDEINARVLTKEQIESSDLYEKIEDK